MDAQRRNARALRFKHSQSLASLLHRFSQPMVRSTIQRLGENHERICGIGPLYDLKIDLLHNAA